MARCIGDPNVFFAAQVPPASERFEPVGQVRFHRAERRERRDFYFTVF